MRKAAIALTAVAGLALVIAGCSKRTAEVPDPVATVNGKPITSEQYINMLSRNFGRQALQGLIEQNIILQWAEQEKAAPTDEQVNKQIDLLKKQNQYEDLVKTAGEEGVRQQLETRQAVINIAKKLNKVSDSEIKMAYEMAKSQFVHGPRKQMSYFTAFSKEQADKDYKSLQDGKDFDAIAASAPNAGAEGPSKLWIDDKEARLPADAVKAIMGTKVGEYCKPISISGQGGMTQYWVVKVIGEMPAENRSLKDAKSEVEDIAALQKISMNPDFLKKLNEKKKDAKIDVSIENLKSIAAVINNPPDPFANMMAPRPMPAPAPKGAPKPAAN